MRRVVLVMSAIVFAGCAKKEEPPAAPTDAMAPAPAPFNLATAAGTWDFKVMAATGDSVLTTYTLLATAADTGWVMTLPNRPPIKLTVMVMGDSLMAQAPSYESVLRKGVHVTTTTNFHLVGDKLMGNTTARYTVTTADSVVMLRSEGTRKP